MINKSASDEKALGIAVLSAALFIIGAACAVLIVLNLAGCSRDEADKDIRAKIVPEHELRKRFNGW